MDIEILSATNGTSFGFYRANPQTSIGEIRKFIYEEFGGPVPQSQLLHLSLENNAALKDDETMETLNLKSGDKLYLKDLGRQIDGRIVYVAQYLGALFIYQRFYVNHKNRYDTPLAVELASACITLHYLKRLYETWYVHRFSRSTMPLFNLFPNCAYDWGFMGYIGWEIHYGWYAAPSTLRVLIALTIFLLCEFGNYSVHLALRRLRPAGTTERHIPMPTHNLFTKLFYLVSCPHFTYEVCAWFAFAMMTACFAALLFAIVGAYKISQLAFKKHQNYLKEFPNYPKQRRAIVPYVF